MGFHYLSRSKAKTYKRYTILHSQKEKLLQYDVHFHFKYLCTGGVFFIFNIIFSEKLSLHCVRTWRFVFSNGFSFVLFVYYLLDLDFRMLYSFELFFLVGNKMQVKKNLLFLYKFSRIVCVFVWNITISSIELQCNYLWSRRSFS